MTSTERTRWHAAASLQAAQVGRVQADVTEQQVRADAERLAFLLRQNNLARRFHVALRGGK